jgi:hypothetical protein
MGVIKQDLTPISLCNNFVFCRRIKHHAFANFARAIQFLPREANVGDIVFCFASSSLRWLQIHNELFVLVARQPISKHLQHRRHITANHRRRIQPEAGKHFAPEHTGFVRV